MIFGIIWISGAVVLWGLIAWMSGVDDHADEPDVLVVIAALWPLVLALLALMAPFMFIRHLGERHAANTKGQDHG